MLTNPLNDRVQPTQTIGALNRLTVVLGHGYLAGQEGEGEDDIEYQMGRGIVTSKEATVLPLFQPQR